MGGDGDIGTFQHFCPMLWPTTGLDYCVGIGMQAASHAVLCVFYNVNFKFGFGGRHVRGM